MIRERKFFIFIRKSANEFVRDAMKILFEFTGVLECSIDRV